MLVFSTDIVCTVPLDFVVSIREKRRGTLAASVIALVYRHHVLDDVYVRVHRCSGRLIYETCIDREAVCIRQHARKRVATIEETVGRMLRVYS